MNIMIPKHHNRLTLVYVENNSYICPITNTQKHMNWKEIVVNGRQLPYKINERGDVYSYRVNRLLKGGTTGKTDYQYKAYYLEYEPNKYKWFQAHRLVYETFIGPIPAGREINHKDLNKLNNHYTNLEAVTRWENIVHARKHKHWQSGRKPGFSVSHETRHKMAQAKYKPVNIYCEDQLVKACESIEETALYLHTYRKKVFRAIKTGQRAKFQGNTYRLEFA